MPFGVELYLDPVSAATVQHMWGQLADVLALPPRTDSTAAEQARPHITLGICQDLDVEVCERSLADFAATMSALVVHFASIGVFATDPAHVFLAPIVTDDVLTVHRRFHERFRAFALNPGEHYLPGQWVPHCTLAEAIAQTEVPRAVDACQQMALPFRARMEEMGLLEFPARHRHAVFPIGH